MKFTKVKVIVSVLVVFFTLLSFRQADTNPTKPLTVYFMKSFDADSISFYSSEENNRNMVVSSRKTENDSIPYVTMQMSAADTLLTIRDLVRGKSYSENYDFQHRYLFVYYNNSKFTFRFSNKLLFVE